MLDNETKRKIDSARNILVGKVPDPKAQVEQITTALIYKFMDDMDREAQELGGHAKFITGELEAYTWARLMSKELSGSERLNLYMSALLDFAKSADIPPIFRTIFKDAFLPYRDPETLSLFLKEIDYFDYDHSENLGNAFEYLLSILGSQGDAGQFRTPRHIIDFIVEVLEPKKNETVLDPACGTAGFLISAYKHIMANNTLTPDEKKTLMHNFTGYDISPDMVRLSLVNMYLHSFPTPKIYEYDTLTSEERWNESFDVILANPPFMTPKGGIRPHNRFSVQANRSEVLFVDYIAEHLNLNGRAGIIVPEGIIFQSANAYKALRKMLIENNFLWAVVSLPAGIFNPYAGVKTSILLLDRTIAKHKEEILFVKVANDGFDLGAQRREINKNDLPSALEVLKKYKLGETIDHPIALAVLKSKIAEIGDYNLMGDRYKENIQVSQTVYQMVKLGDICEVYQPQTITASQLNPSGTYKVFGANGVIGYYDSYNHEEAEVAITCRGATCGTINYTESKSWITGNAMVVKPKNENNLSKLYLYHLLNATDLSSTITGAAQPQITRTSLSPFEIPLPPIEIQNEIVSQIEEWQKIIDGAKQVINTYHPTITINPDWEMVKLGEVIIFENGKAHEQCIKEGGKYKVINSKFISSDGKIFKCSDEQIVPLFEKDVVMVMSDVPNGKAIAKCFFVDKNSTYTLNQRIGLFRIKNLDVLIPEFLHLQLNRNLQLLAFDNGQSQTNLRKDEILGINFFIPPLEIQNKIVEQIEKERQAIESCKTLVEIFEAKIKAKIDEVWGNV